MNEQLDRDVIKRLKLKIIAAEKINSNSASPKKSSQMAEDFKSYIEKEIKK